MELIKFSTDGLNMSDQSAVKVAKKVFQYIEVQKEMFLQNPTGKTVAF